MSSSLLQIICLLVLKTLLVWFSFRDWSLLYFLPFPINSVILPLDFQSLLVVVLFTQLSLTTSAMRLSICSFRLLSLYWGLGSIVIKCSSSPCQVIETPEPSGSDYSQLFSHFLAEHTILPTYPTDPALQPSVFASFAFFLACKFSHFSRETHNLLFQNARIVLTPLQCSSRWSASVWCFSETDFSGHFCIEVSTRDLLILPPVIYVCLYLEQLSSQIFIPLTQT